MRVTAVSDPVFCVTLCNLSICCLSVVSGSPTESKAQTIEKCYVRESRAAEAHGCDDVNDTTSRAISNKTGARRCYRLYNQSTGRVSYSLFSLWFANVLGKADLVNTSKLFVFSTGRIDYILY